MRFDPQPHWNTATTTPYAAPTDSRFITAALIPMARDRNAAVSSSSDNSTTAPMSNGSRSTTRVVKSTLPTVEPVRYVVAGIVGKTWSRTSFTSVVVASACGLDFGITLRMAASPAWFTDGGNTDATSFVCASVCCALVSNVCVCDWDWPGGIDTSTVSGPFAPCTKPSVM